ncbi:MAG: MBL fold metallo-hydrolase, partial [Puniceicoccaceae bacterium]
MKDQLLNKNHRTSISRREFLGHAGAIGLGYTFLRGSGSIARAASAGPVARPRQPGLIFETFEAGGISHYSYFIGDDINGTAVVIDPKRDVDDYLGLARKHRLRITHVLETHVHADFVSGLRELVDQTGAAGCASVEGDARYGFPVKPLRDGDIIETGNIRLKAIF